MRTTMFLSVLFAFITACGDSNTEFEGPQDFVGALEGTDILMGVTVDGDTFSAYVCGDANLFATHSRWFDGTVGEAGSFSATVDGWVLDGRVIDGVADFTLRDPLGVDLAASFNRLTDRSLGGIFDNTDFGCRVGAVVAPGPDGPRLQGAWCNPDQDYVAQVTPVRIAELTAVAESFEASVVDSDQAPFLMRRVR